MMEKQVTKESPKQVLLRTLNIGVAGLTGWYLGKFAFSGAFGIGVLGFAGFFVIAIVIHELGHVLGALKVNFRICSFIVGPITIGRAGGRTTVRWGTFQIGGMVTLAPNGTDDLRRRMLIVTAAGPAASIVGGVFAFVIGFVVPISATRIRRRCERLARNDRRRRAARKKQYRNVVVGCGALST